MKIAEVNAQEEFVLRILNDQGKVGYFDVSPYLEAPAFQPLRERGEFEQVRNGGYFVEWRCGADLSADTIALHWVVEAG